MNSRIRGGFSVLETVLAFCIFTSVFCAVMFSFMGASRQAVEMESRTKEAMMAQMILERMRDRIRVNDTEFQAMIASAETVYFGTVTRHESGPGAGIDVNPFFQYLFARDGGDLFTDANKDSLTDAAIAFIKQNNNSSSEGPIHPLDQGMVDIVKDASNAMALFSHSDCSKLLGRVGGYPTRFAGNLSLAQLSYQKLITDDRADPDDRLVSLKKWAQIIKARRIFNYKVQDLPDDITSSLVNKYEHTFRDLAEYFEHDNINDKQQLKTRNPRFTALARAMKQLLPPSWFGGIVRAFAKDGPVLQFILRYQSLCGRFGLPPTPAVKRLARRSRNVEREMTDFGTYYSAAIDEEILRILREGVPRM